MLRASHECYQTIVMFFPDTIPEIQMGRDLKLVQYISLDPPNLLQTVFPVRFDFVLYILRPRLDS